MNRKTIIVIVIIVLVLSLILLVSRAFLFPCEYENFAWGAVKGKCDCIGIKIDTSCKTPSGGPCPDAGESSGCIGIIMGRECYEMKNTEWTEVSC